MEEREAAVAATSARVDTAVKLGRRHYEAEMERARQEREAADGLQEMAADRLEQAEMVLAVAVAREEESRRQEQERLRFAENALQDEKEGVEEQQEALLAWEERLDACGQQLDGRETALEESLAAREQ